MSQEWINHRLNSISSPETQARLLSKPTVTAHFVGQEDTPQESKVLTFITMGGSRAIWGYQFDNKFNYCTDPRYFREHLWILLDLLTDLEQWINTTVFSQLVLASQTDLNFIEELVWWIGYQHPKVKEEHPQLERLACILLFFVEQAKQNKPGCIVLERTINREWLRTGTKQNLGYWLGDKPLSPIFYPTGDSEKALVKTLEVKFENKDKIESKVRRQLNNNPDTASKDIKGLYQTRQEILESFKSQQPVSLLDRHTICVQIWQKYWKSFDISNRKSAGHSWHKKQFLKELNTLKAQLAEEKYYLIHPQNSSFLSQTHFFLHAEHYQNVSTKLLNADDELSFTSQVFDGEFAQVETINDTYISKQTNLRLRAGDKVYLYQEFKKPVDTTTYTIKHISKVKQGNIIQLDSPLTFDDVTYIIPQDKISLPKTSPDDLNINNIYRTPYTHQQNVEIIDIENNVKKENWLESLNEYSRHPQEIEKNLFTQTLEDILQNQPSSPLMLIDSPPGAGKTGVIEHVSVANSKILGKRVLIMTQTNSQLKDLAQRITNNWKVPVYILSANNIEYSKTELQVDNIEYLYQKEEGDSDDSKSIKVSYKLEHLPQTPHIVIATSSKIRTLKYQEEAYDLQIIEEAYQMADHMWLQTAAIAKQFFLVGDPKQIDPVTSIAELMEPYEANPYPTHFSAPRNLIRRHKETTTYQLPVSRRLPKDSAEFLQNNLYPADFEFTALSSYPEDRYILSKSKLLAPFKHQSLFSVSAPTQETLYTTIVENILTELKTGNLYDDKWGDNTSKKIQDSDIGIICTHREQVQTLKTLSNKLNMPNVFCETAERYQGREQAIMIVLHPLWGDISNIDFLTDPGKLSVMLSRHRVGCIVVLPHQAKNILQEIPLKQKQKIIPLNSEEEHQNPILLNLQVLENLT